MEVKVEGLAEALRKLSPELYSEPLRKFWERAGIEVLNAAKLRAAVGVSGRMRASLAKGAASSVWDLDSGNPPKSLRIGTNVNRNGFFYPRALEESDKYHYRGGGAGGASNLQAKVKGALSGEPTKGWFSNAFKDALPQIKHWLVKLSEEIAAKWPR